MTRTSEQMPVGASDLSKLEDTNSAQANMKENLLTKLEGEKEAERTGSDPKAKPYTTFKGLGELKPESEDETVLFSGNWLGQGGGLLLTAPSGVGKSSLISQALFSWVLGKEFLAQPMRPLNCALVQSEDSKRDLQEIRDGMIRGFQSNGWSEKEIDAAMDGVHIWKCVGKTGDTFIEWLRGMQHSDPCDVIAINPIQGFFGGDVAKQDEVSHFLRDGLDPIIKGEDGLHPCAVVLIQHTPKIASGQKEGRATVDDYSEYIGAGSHEWTDWCRAKFVFLKKKSSDDYFDLKAAKRGKRLKWVGPDGNPTTKKVLAHSDGFIFWRVVSDPAEIASADGEAQRQPSERELETISRKENDKGVEENAKWLLAEVDAAIALDKELDNDAVRAMAAKRWQKEIARDAVPAFERMREAAGISKVKGCYAREKKPLPASLPGQKDGASQAK